MSTAMQVVFNSYPLVVCLSSLQTAAHSTPTHESLYMSDVQLAYQHSLVSRDEAAARIQQLEDQISGLQRELQGLQIGRAHV